MNFLSALLPDLMQLPFYNATLFAEKLIIVIFIKTQREQ